MSSVLIVVERGTDPATFVDRSISDANSDECAVVVDMEAIASMRDGVENGIRMVIGMQRMFHPRVRSAIVRVPDLAVTIAMYSAGPLIAWLEEIASIIERAPTLVSLIAGCQRDFLTKSAKIGRAFTRIDHVDDSTKSTLTSIAHTLLHIRLDDDRILDHVEATNAGASDLLAALCATVIWSANDDPSRTSRILATAFFRHALLARDLSPAPSSEGYRFRLGSPSFAFVIGACELIAQSRDASTIHGTSRGSSMSRYDKAAYMARRRLSRASLPSHPLCLSALHGDRSPEVVPADHPRKKPASKKPHNNYLSLL